MALQLQPLWQTKARLGHVAKWSSAFRGTIVHAFSHTDNYIRDKQTLAREYITAVTINQNYYHARWPEMLNVMQIR